MHKTPSNVSSSLVQIVEDKLSQHPSQNISEWEKIFIKLLAQAASETPLTSERLEIIENTFEAVYEIKKENGNQQVDDKEKLVLTNCRLNLYSCLTQAQEIKLSEKEIHSLRSHLSADQIKIIEQYLLTMSPVQNTLYEVFSKSPEKIESNWLESFSLLKKVDTKALAVFTSIKEKTYHSSEVLEHFLQTPLKQIDHLKELAAFSSYSSETHEHSYETAVKFVREIQSLQLLNIYRKPSQLSIRPCFLELYHSLEGAVDAFLQAGLLPLAAKVKELSFLLAEQPYTLVVAGEAKRGKSTLVNAIIGQPISTVRETLNETAVPITFKWGKKFKATVTFFSQDELDTLSVSGAEQAELLAEEKFSKLLGTTFSIREEESLASYISFQSPLSSLVKEIEVRIPARVLEKGLILVDTPGLNSRSAIHNYFAYEKCLGADCLLLVLDALHPESASEAYLIERISRAGRSSSFAAVLTGIDRLSEKSSITNALARGRELLSIAEKLGQSDVGVAAIDARKATEESIRNNGKSVPKGLRTIFDSIFSQQEKQHLRPTEEVSATLKKVKSALEEAITVTQDKKREDLSKVPTEREIQFICQQVVHLSKIRKQLLDRVLNVTASFSLDIESWKNSVSQQVDLWQSRCILKVMDAARKYGEELGDEAIFDSEKWKIFDQTVTPTIIRDCLNETLSACLEQEKLWKQKIERFDKELKEIGTDCQRKIEFSSRDFEQLPKTSLLIQKNLSALNSLANKAVTFGAGVTVVQGDSLGLMARGLDSVLKGNPLLILSALVLIALRKFGQIDQCKKRLFRKKEENLAKWVASKKQDLEQELLQEQLSISDHFQEAICRSFSPLINNLEAQIILLESYGNLLSEIRRALVEKDSDCLMKLQEALRQANKVEEPSFSKS